jgi:hypothetical protein
MSTGPKKKKASKQSHTTKRKKAPRPSAEEPRKPATQGMAAFSDHAAILAQMATRIFCRVVYQNNVPSTTSVDESVRLAWSILQTAKKCIDEGGSFKIPRKKGEDVLKPNRDTRKKIQEITSETRTKRALGKFKKFLEGGALKRGRNMTRSLIGVKSYEEYLRRGIEDYRVEDLKKIYNLAFPKKGEKVQEINPLEIMSPPRRQIILDPDGTSDF